MKFSLISATSIIALFSASVWPSQAAVQTVASAQANIYDLVHDGMTSADGGDATVSMQDPTVTAVLALEAATINRPGTSFTGPVDLSAEIGRLPRIPLGSAPGTRPDDDFATPIAGAWQWDALRKARAIGMDRVAPLIGTVGDASVEARKSVSTVFVEAGGPGFNETSGVRSSSVAVAFAPSGTSTATFTVAGAGNFRQRGASGFTVAAANSLQAMPAAISDQAPAAIAMADAAQPTLGYHYAPAPVTAGRAVEASFSDAITANGSYARLDVPGTQAKVQTSEVSPDGRQGQGSKIRTSELQLNRQPGQTATSKVQTSQLGSGQAQPGNVQTSELQRGQERIKTSDVAAAFGKLIDPSQPVSGPGSDTQVDGTRTFISASVSANPSMTAVQYMANVVNAAPTIRIGQTIEAFQIGPAAGPRTHGDVGTTVSRPVGGKIMASAGALNNSLALP